MSQLGGDTMILLTLKMKLFYMGVHTALGKSQKFAFDPKCRITLVHSLKTMRDDWWLHTEVAFFPLLYTSLFVKSSRKENDKDSILWKDTAAFRRLCPFLKKSGKGTWLIGGSAGLGSPYDDFQGQGPIRVHIPVNGSRRRKRGGCLPISRVHRNKGCIPPASITHGEPALMSVLI